MSTSPNPSLELSGSLDLLKHVKLNYHSIFNRFLFFLLLMFMASRLSCNNFLRISVVFLYIATLYVKTRPRAVYLIDFACYKPPFWCRVPNASFLEHSREIIGEDRANFMMRVLERSGLGEETALPPLAHYIPPEASLGGSRDESELIIFTAVDDLFQKTGVDPKDINVVVVNCNSFAPMPSLASMIVNRYKLRADVRSFNLSGMGCSASPISIGLARDILRVQPDSTVLVFSTEIIVSPAWYTGTQRSMLIPNCLFRMGGAAILLSNRPRHRADAKYRLHHVVRTHIGADDKAYKCLYQVEDADGRLGISLSKEVMPISGQAMKRHLIELGQFVLPWWEQLLFVATLLRRSLIDPKAKVYTPEFRKAFEHICVHAGGRAVIDEVQMNLGLSAEQVEASRMALHRFGNTSSSSVWYELSYMEAKGRMKKGDRVWQIGLGSGFKCNSSVWECVKAMDKVDQGPWSGCIDRYPVEVPEVLKF
ncbi:3-ketoacyl-CoA synthase 6-like [Ananas comosus]|uniref:3-ketoacyl-CoA synthase n=2 Tax=Ananas comosus TaxID=4615 RepID=A0A6P5GQT8_ANACO|nr:3-ketoacyl-CoA synthase 6-like [Ananas comosus]